VLPNGNIGKAWRSLFALLRVRLVRGALLATPT
jgi:hypothetical protein